MVISERGITLIKNFEGLRLTAYRCPAGVLTVGFGSTRDVKKGMTITEAEADKRLQDDLIPVQAAVTKLVNVPLTQGQFDALCSFVLNVGVGAFKDSTLLKLLNQGKYDAACRQFDRWTHVKGKSLPGLVRRRDAEQSLWKSDAMEGHDDDAGTLSNHEIEASPPKPLTDSKTLQGGAVAMIGGAGLMQDQASKVVDHVQNWQGIVDRVMQMNHLPVLCGLACFAGVAFMIVRYVNDRHERA